MSRSIDLFIGCDRPVAEVAAELERLTGLEVVPGAEPERWVLEEKGVHAQLGVHPYVDDAELPLGRYPYALSCRVASGTRPADAPETALLRMVSEALQKAGLPTLLVHDLQYRDRAPADAEGGGAAEAGAERVTQP